jgi:hypothetical protein
VLSTLHQRLLSELATRGRIKVTILARWGCPSLFIHDFSSAACDDPPMAGDLDSGLLQDKPDVGILIRHRSLALTLACDHGCISRRLPSRCQVHQYGASNTGFPSFIHILIGLSILHSVTFLIAIGAIVHLPIPADNQVRSLVPSICHLRHSLRDGNFPTLWPGRRAMDSFRA